MALTCAYKLLRVRSDGTLGPLFINRAQHIPLGLWLPAEAHLTPGYAYRPRWHAAPAPDAPHLSLTGRAWYHVYLHGVTTLRRPPSQGGLWYLARWLYVTAPAGTADRMPVTGPQLAAPDPDHPAQARRAGRHHQPQAGHHRGPGPFDVPENEVAAALPSPEF